jgi:hypothetical protein
LTSVCGLCFTVSVGAHWEMKENRKDEQVFTRITRDESVELVEIATILDISVSQIIREGLREKVEFLKANHPKLREQN